MSPIFTRPAVSRHAAFAILFVAVLASAYAPAAQAPLVGDDVTVARRSDGAASSVSTSGLCIGCQVSNPGAVVSDTLGTSAALRTAIGIGNSVTLGVRFSADQPGGRHAGFAIATPPALLDVQLLSALTLATYRNGQQVESATGAALLTLGALSEGSSVRTVSMATTTPFDEVRLSIGSVASVLTEANVYYAYTAATAGASVVLNGGASIGSGFLGDCLGCQITTPGAIIDADLLNRTILTVPGTATGSAYVDVALGVQAAPRRITVAVETAFSDDQIRAMLQVSTFLDGAFQETGTALTVRAGTGTLRLIEIQTLLRFNEVRIQLSALPGSLGTAIGLASITVDADVTTASDAPSGAGKAEMTRVYPNPMRGVGTVGLRLAAPENVRVALYDMLGRQVALVFDGAAPAGESQFRISGDGLAAGLYVCRAEGESFALTQRVTVTR